MNEKYAIFWPPNVTLIFMKNFPLKKAAIAILAIGVAIFGIFYFTTSKGTKAPTPFINPAFGEYISSYTAGVVSATSPIRVVLSKTAIDSALIGQETDVKLFSFSPGIKGKTVWVDLYTVEFRPESKLESGQVYEVSFYLSKLIEVKGDLSTFEYSFQTIPQNFEVSIDNIRPYVKTELKRQKIEGTLSTADMADSEAVEKMISPVQQGKKLSVTWLHTNEGRQHQFVIEDVSRQDEETKVNLSIEGKPLGVERTDEKEVVIPSLSDFKLMQARVVQNPSQHIVLQFSDPLKDNQNLQGLITVTEMESLEFSIRENEILVYLPVRQTGTKTVRIEAGIRNILDYKMKEAATAEVVFEQVAPAVRFTGKGSILPSTDGLMLPFEAVNLNSVDVTVFKIYQKNILQFLQVNNLSGNQELHRVGKKLIKKNVPLNTSGITDPGKWNRFTVDLTTLIQAEPGAVYQVKLSFKKSYSAYHCDGESTETETTGQFEEDEEDGYNFNQEYYYGYEEDYYYEGDYDWEQRENPCHSSYYTSNRFITKNILASDLGLTTKTGKDGNVIVFVTDIRSTEPMQGVQVDLYDYQQQVVGTGVTGSDGKIVIPVKEPAFAVIARNGQQYGYLKLTDGEALSVSGFDVSGEIVDKGLKGFLYGDRGVWRPGDSLYLTFILEDKLKKLPPNHPVVFELQNPQGQVVNRLVKSVSENGFYSLATSTAPDAPTGNWTGKVKVGGFTYTQNLKIETVKPNRLKINLDFGTERFTSSNASGNLEVKWLHGAPAKNLKAEFELTLVTVPTTFKKFEDYTFEDPAREFISEAKPAFSSVTDSDGKASVNVDLGDATNAPGLLSAIFRGKVYEESGNFSIDRFAIPYSPYDSYTGIKTPDGEKYSGILYFDTPHEISLATLDADGKGVSRNLDINLYKLNWRWWWDNSYDGLANYIEGSSSRLVKSANARTTNGKGTWTMQLKQGEFEYGRYYIRACDAVSGHCTGKIVYVDEPGWYSRMRDEGSEAPSILSFTTDKNTYNIGEKVNVTIPGAGHGRALVSVETGSRVLQTYWVETQQGETRFSFDVTPEMAPNVYVHVSLLQPHDQTVNDLPIRLYGITRIGVEDPQTHLEPVIAMDDVLEPGKEVSIRISEKSKRKMTYTIAVVDEGLLDITRFKTPDPWNRFYSKEALGVRTWDLFDDVMGAFGARLERVLSIGGDAELAAKADDPRANRFKPVVKFFGPFTLDGGSATHSFIMPQYIGSVRTMVVAGYEGAYGKTEKATPVRKPLMVLATLPRVLGPEELVRLPITLFSNDKNLRNVKVEVRTTGPVSVSGESRKNVTMNTTGDMTIDFDLKVAAETGISEIEVIASSGNVSSSDKIEIEIRNPNLPVSRITDTILDQGKTWNTEVIPYGISGTNTALVEVSNLPPVNLGSRLKYLIRYPYGCVEQTTSAVFPQLFVDRIKVLTPAEKTNIQRNVTAGIERLKTFLQRDGGFSYWPGAENSDSWGTSYAGHFLVEAVANGYFVPDDMLRKWKKYQKNKASEWRRDDRYNTDLMQAYRLYTLALAGSAEIGTMNRLREDASLSASAAWMLAASYAKAGQPEAARKIIANRNVQVKPYRELGYSYGSDLRDRALILETLVLLNDKAKAFDLLREISRQLSDPNYWMSTQETAMCLKAIGSFAGMEKRGELKFSYTLNGKTIHASTELSVAQVQVPVTGIKKQSVQVVNEGGGVLYTRLIQEGTPARGDEEDASNNLNVQIRYTDNNGNELDITRLEQGTEFLAEVSVMHVGGRTYYENLALSQVFPSGWEINNLRLTDDESLVTTSAYNYQDIRDDRVYTYFGLYTGERKIYKVKLTATYAGTYYLPAISCEAMYDKSIYARKKGYVVEVVKPVTQ